MFVSHYLLLQCLCIDSNQSRKFGLSLSNLGPNSVGALSGSMLLSCEMFLDAISAVNAEIDMISLDKSKLTVSGT